MHPARILFAASVRLDFRDDLFARGISGERERAAERSADRDARAA